MAEQETAGIRDHRGRRRPVSGPGRRPRVALAAGALAIAAWMVGPPRPAGASHVLFGSLFWEGRPDVDPNAVEFQFRVGVRREEYAGTAGDGFLATGDYFNEFVGGTNLCFGDATCTDTLIFRVVAYDPVFGWALGEAVTVTPGPGTGNSVAESEPNDALGTADPIAIGDDATGTLAAAELDCFSVPLAAGDVARVSLTTPDLGDAFFSIGGPSLEWLGSGDPGSPAAFVALTTGPHSVCVADALDDTGSYTLSVRPATKVDEVVHTYAAAGDYLAFSGSCCRLEACDDAPGTLLNNDGEDYRFETTVTAGGSNASPTSSLPPIVTCAGNCSFFVPGADSDGEALTFRLATDAEANGVTPFDQPGEGGTNACANPLAIDTSTGLVTWDTTGCETAAVCADASFTTTFYSLQVRVEDGETSVPVDFVIQLLPPSPNVPPAFTSAACGGTIHGSIGQPLAFGVSASDTDAGDSVDLNLAALPDGAWMTPVLPQNGNPVSSTFSWTPGPGDVGTVALTFTATDESAAQAFCAVNVEVAGASVLEIPTLGGLGAVALGAGLAGCGFVLVRRRRSRRRAHPPNGSSLRDL